MARKRAEAEFGDRVKAIREAGGMALKDVAEKSGMMPQALVKIERGITNNPTLKTIRAIAAALGVSPCKLIE